MQRRLLLTLRLAQNLRTATAGAVARPLALGALQRYVQPAAPALQVMLEANAGSKAKVSQQLGQMMTFDHLQLVHVNGFICNTVWQRIRILVRRIITFTIKKFKRLLDS